MPGGSLARHPTGPSTNWEIREAAPDIAAAHVASRRYGGGVFIRLAERREFGQLMEPCGQPFAAPETPTAGLQVKGNFKHISLGAPG
mmetsp:Transcript_99011/g.288756  ORF Transcript_99011/g.288756 Transcript_99011/m.288756 type:complete len:87 (-) Transcript_99011:1472-1732(-)